MFFLRRPQCYTEVIYPLTLIPMGAGAGDADMKEIVDTPSSVQLKQHRDLIQKFLDQGYEIEKEETSSEDGLKGELVSETIETILKPPSKDMPKVRFLATQTYGDYDFETETYQEYEAPGFSRKIYQKSAEMTAFNDPWQEMQM